MGPPLFLRALFDLFVSAPPLLLLILPVGRADSRNFVPTWLCAAALLKLAKRTTLFSAPVANVRSGVDLETEARSILDICAMTPYTHGGKVRTRCSCRSVRWCRHRLIDLQEQHVQHTDIPLGAAGGGVPARRRPAELQVLRRAGRSCYSTAFAHGSASSANGFLADLE